MISLKKGIFSGNALKIFAALFMVMDHVGFAFSGVFPLELTNFLRGAGRIALPLFAFLIAEGCRYTKDRKKYFLLIFLLGIVCDVVYYVAMEELYLCILTTFSLSILLIYSYDGIVKSITQKDGDLLYNVIKFASVLSLAVLTDYLCEKQGGTFDYGYIGAILPLTCYVLKNKWLRLIPIALGVFALCFNNPFGTQSFYLQMLGFISLIFIALYNGERGKLKLKNFFYLFYPLHLLLIEGIYLLYFILQ